jgi:hypothetical protein
MRLAHDRMCHGGVLIDNRVQDASVRPDLRSRADDGLALEEGERVDDCIAVTNNRCVHIGGVGIDDRDARFHQCLGGSGSQHLCNFRQLRARVDSGSLFGTRFESSHAPAVGAQ